jgi:hypothetical protein
MEAIARALTRTQAPDGREVRMQPLAVDMPGAVRELELSAQVWPAHPPSSPKPATRKRTAQASGNKASSPDKHQQHHIKEETQ